MMSVRSKDQLAVMLKLIDVNRISLTRKNLSVRQRVWQAITHKLNQMQGAEKDIDGWKRSYYTWKQNAGSDYEKEMQRIIKEVPYDDYFYIETVEDDNTRPNESADMTENVMDPNERQRLRLHELVSKHRQILQSAADDEPLKTRIWLNITEELNSIAGAVKLKPNEWKERVDWRKYCIKRGRKRRSSDTITTKGTKRKNIKFDVTENYTMDAHTSAEYNAEYEEFLIENSALPSAAAQEEALELNLKVDLTEDEDMSNDSDGFIDKLLNDDDDMSNISYNSDEEDWMKDNPKPHTNAMRPNPLMKSFHYSNRMVNALESLSNNIKDMKELLQQNNNTLAGLENALQQQCRKQDETNALLKRNNQLLKVLIEYKRCRRTRNMPPN